MKKQQSVTIKSGFQRGAEVWRYIFATSLTEHREDKLEMLARVPDCTWSGDPIEEETVSWYPSMGEFYITAYWRIDGMTTKVWSFEGNDRDMLPPQMGIYEEVTSFCSSEGVLVESLTKYIEAKISNRWKPLQEVLINGTELSDGSVAFVLDFEAGSQNAAKFLIVTPEGEMYEESGVGERTPWITSDGRITNDVNEEWLQSVAEEQGLAV